MVFIERITTGFEKTKIGMKLFHKYIDKMSGCCLTRNPNTLRVVLIMESIKIETNDPEKFSILKVKKCT